MTAHKRGAAATRIVDKERLAYHGAAQAVVSWKLGLGVGYVSIDPDAPTPCDVRPRQKYGLGGEPNAAIRRYLVGQTAMLLLASSVTEQLLRPGTADADVAIDHEQVHGHMSAVEDDAATRITWCDYLWQRTYTLLSWPGHWKLLVALVPLLRAAHPLSGQVVENHMHRVQHILQHDSSMPNAVLLSEVKHICSPWHRDWHTTSAATTLSPRRTDLPEAVKDLEALMLLDLRPVREALGPISRRAQSCLDRREIRTVMDLRCWSRWALGSIWGAGRVTLQEIVAAAERAGIRLPPDDAPLPWVADPQRWR